MSETVACPVCSKSASRESFIEEYTYDLEQVPVRYCLYRCKNCTLEFWDPRTLSKEFYEEDKYNIYKHSFFKTYRYTSPFVQNPPVKRGKLLDVGCGEGPFLLEAREKGFDVYGIDCNRNAVDVAKGKGLDNVYPMFLKEFIAFASSRGVKFDVVSFFEVLEHQDDIRRYLNEIKSLLKPGGWIVGSVPYRSYGNGDYPPHHFSLWSEKALLTLFQDDFEAITVTYLYDVSTIKGRLVNPLTGKISRLLSKYKKGIGGNSSMSGGGVFFYRLLKSIRDILFLPVSVPEKVVRKMMKKPTNYYFQARLKG